MHHVRKSARLQGYASLYINFTLCKKDRMMFFKDEEVVYANRSCRELKHDLKEQTNLLSTGTMEDDDDDGLALLLWMY